MDNDGWLPFFWRSGLSKKYRLEEKKTQPLKQLLRRMGPIRMTTIPTFPGPSCNSHHPYLGFQMPQGTRLKKERPSTLRDARDAPTTLSEGFVGRIHHDLGKHPLGTECPYSRNAHREILKPLAHEAWYSPLSSEECAKIWFPHKVCAKLRRPALFEVMKVDGNSRARILRYIDIWMNC